MWLSVLLRVSGYSPGVPTKGLRQTTCTSSRGRHHHSLVSRRCQTWFVSSNIGKTCPDGLCAHVNQTRKRGLYKKEGIREYFLLFFPPHAQITSKHETTKFNCEGSWGELS